MSYNSLWQQWRRFLRPARQARQSHKRCRPVLERLDTRDVPSGLPPTANSIGGLSVVHGHTLSGIDLAANCSDPENDMLMINIVTMPSHGMVMLNQSTGKYDYTANTMDTGPDSFTFRAFDGTGESNLATVSLTVTNTAPTANNLGPFTVAHGDTLTNIDLAGNVSDADQDLLNVAITAYPIWV